MAGNFEDGLVHGDLASTERRAIGKDQLKARTADVVGFKITVGDGCRGMEKGVIDGLEHGVLGHEEGRPAGQRDGQADGDRCRKDDAKAKPHALRKE